MSTDAREVQTLRRESTIKSPNRNEQREKVTRYTRRDQGFFYNRRKSKESPIKYDFKDPVLNKEIRETLTHHN